ncbi:MAG: hypothetical protein KatS3mg120_0709 [Erythrobacter sp.]|nr:MAG: hypothetical protein KatS3mg120_0709 [Erythrobacter sp.]
MGAKAASARPVLIAQMTDIHVGFAPEEKPEELNLVRFRATYRRLIEGPNRPDMLVLTGDITDHGDDESFAKAAELLKDCPFPVVPMVGNHDSRRGLLSAFPQVTPAEGGFLHYVVEAPLGLRIICLDTLEDGRHGGAFCEARAAWLAARLAEAPDQPTLIFMHHPPVVAGIDWMDPAPDEPWIMRLHKVLARAEPGGGDPLRPPPPPDHHALCRNPARGDALGRATGGDGFVPDRPAHPR